MVAGNKTCFLRKYTDFKHDIKENFPEYPVFSYPFSISGPESISRMALTMGFWL